eukprot:scaffold2848_cov150-Skeletonema_menzelii.AAC.13
MMITKMWDLLMHYLRGEPDSPKQNSSTRRALASDKYLPSRASHPHSYTSHPVNQQPPKQIFFIKEDLCNAKATAARIIGDIMLLSQSQSDPYNQRRRKIKSNNIEDVKKATANC